jgi:hypothetical protein
MNGKTTIDATLNPCSAEMDRHTYGWRLLNVSTWGNRLIRVCVLYVCLDLYQHKRLPWMRRFLYTRIRNGASLIFPGGMLSWPMPDKANTKDQHHE